MRAVAEATGFVLEGTRRQAAWIDGAFVDSVIYGRLDG
jgi:RimJ/RimL family protein N-acetyltransferase